MLDRQTPYPNPVVADHDGRTFVQVADDLVEVGQEKPRLALGATRHLSPEQDDAWLHCSREREERSEVRIEGE